MQKYKVQFNASFEVEFECEPAELADNIADINIPEYPEVKYVPDSFDVINVKNEDGSELPLEDII